PDEDTTRALDYRSSSLASYYVVSDSYFPMLGLRTRSGRSFLSADAASAEPAVVISAATAKALWGDANPIGRVLQRTVKGDRLRVIGVVDDIKEMANGRNGHTAAPGIDIYYTARQAMSYSPEILATSTGDLLGLRTKIVDLVRVADPTLFVWNATTLASQLDE